MRRHISWILAICTIVFSPYIVRGITLYNDPLWASLYLTGFGVTLLFLFLTTVEDIARYCRIG